jgi:hypothetical protein
MGGLLQIMGQDGLSCCELYMKIYVKSGFVVAVETLSTVLLRRGL